MKKTPPEAIAERLAKKAAPPGESKPRVRRFELVSGTVHKFWEVHLARAKTWDGLSGWNEPLEYDNAGGRRWIVMTFSGRIQRWQKLSGHRVPPSNDTVVDLPSAERLVERMVEERLARGYVETATRSPAAPAPTGTHPDGTVIAWTESSLRGVAPIRGSGAVPLPPRDAALAYQELRAAVDMMAPVLDAGERVEHADVATVRRVREAFSAATPPDALDLDTQAAAFALLGQALWDPSAADETTGPADLQAADLGCAQTLARYWVAKSGPHFALEAILRGARLQVTCSPVFLTLGPGDIDPIMGWTRRDWETWRAIRYIAATASDVEHAELLTRARSLLAEATPELRGALAAGFERLEWSQADVATVVRGEKRQVPTWFYGLLVSAPSVDALKGLLGKVDHIGKGKPTAGFRLDALSCVEWLFSWGRRLPPLPNEFVARYGGAGITLLIDTLSQTRKSDLGTYNRLMAALALVPSREVAAYFLRVLHDNGGGWSVIDTYFRKHPELLSTPIAEVASGPPRPERLRVPKGAGELYWGTVQSRSEAEIVLGLAVTNPDAMPLDSASASMGVLLLKDALRSKGESSDLPLGNEAWVRAHVDELIVDLSVQEIDFSKAGVGDQALITIRVANPALLGGLAPGDSFDSTAYCL